MPGLLDAIGCHDLDAMRLTTGMYLALPGQTPSDAAGGGTPLPVALKALIAQTGWTTGEVKAACERALGELGHPVVHDSKLGFIATCPSNIGTSLRASVFVKLPKLATPCRWLLGGATGVPLMAAVAQSPRFGRPLASCPLLASDQDEKVSMPNKTFGRPCGLFAQSLRAVDC